MTTNLWADNTPSSFWRFLTDPGSEQWQAAVKNASTILALRHQTSNIEELAETVLGEGQFGADHWRLSRVKQLYYQFVRPFLPSFLRPPLRRLLLSRQNQKSEDVLRWPIEDRFVRFQFEVVKNILDCGGLLEVPYIHFWPDGKRFAFVLTHDVEGVSGYEFIREVVALEEKYGFHSSFNFVPEAYQVDLRFIEELQERGFEVGVHGLKHDGKLFSSKEIFDERCKKINDYAKKWRAVGFRSPMTHRNPEWMQSLDIEYDLSFFDTDPYEPISGGTMSIWPFCLGRFVELPYTLAQDHTLMVTLGEKTPRLWLEKVDFIKRYCGMALVNTHPDYLREGNHLSIYEEFLRQVQAQGEYWHALPREVARWWRHRQSVSIESVSSPRNTDDGVVIGSIRRVHTPFGETTSGCPIELVFSAL
ncbi:MAG: hypothetical protein Q7T89_16935 [Anaerolineales bacterium]|nr:hypothetical protein [Anaerolineales bacterium]